MVAQCQHLLKIYFECDKLCLDFIKSTFCFKVFFDAVDSCCFFFILPQVVRPADICTDELSGKSRVDINEETAWPSTTSPPTTTIITATTTSTPTSKAEESTGVAPMKQRKFSFKHGKVSTTNKDEDDAHGGGYEFMMPIVMVIMRMMKLMVIMIFLLAMNYDD